MPADGRSDTTKPHDGAREVLVWRVIDRHLHTCEFRCQHEVETWASKRLTETGTYTMDNGYEKRTMGVYVDRQGRTYYARIEIDFYASTYYVHQPKPGGPYQHWQNRPHSVGDRVAVDILGRLL